MAPTRSPADGGTNAVTYSRRSSDSPTKKCSGNKERHHNCIKKAKSVDDNQRQNSMSGCGAVV